jgi:hypothetical protein
MNGGSFMVQKHKKFSKEYYREMSRVAHWYIRLGFIFAGLLVLLYDFDKNVISSPEEKSFVVITLCMMFACVLGAMYFFIQSHPNTNLDIYQPRDPE